MRQVEERAHSPEIEAALRRQALGKTETGRAAGRRGTREPDPQEPAALDAQPADARRNAPRAAPGLAEHLHVHQEPGRVAAGDARRGTADRRRAAVDRGNVHARAVPRLERGHQYFGAAFLSAGHLFPPVALERAQVPGPDSGGHGLPRHDADRRRARSSAATSRSTNWRRRRAIPATWGAPSN